MIDSHIYYIFKHILLISTLCGKKVDQFLKFKRKEAPSSGRDNYERQGKFIDMNTKINLQTK